MGLKDFSFRVTDFLREHEYAKERWKASTVFGGAKIGGDLGELIESGLQIFYDLSGKNGRVR